MTHYNPTEHHDKLMKHIASAIVCNIELDLPQIPVQNDGRPSKLLQTEDEAYLFTDIELWNQLVKDAFDSLEGWNNGMNFREQMTEEELEWIRKIVIHPKDGTISVLE